MALVAYDIDELDREQGYLCLYCLVGSTPIYDFNTGRNRIHQVLNIYQTARSRKYGLRWWRSQANPLGDTVFFTFEIPLDFYLEQAKKHI